MLKLDVIIILVAISWFLCSERSEIDEPDTDDEISNTGGDAVTETTDSTKGNDSLIGLLKAGSIVAVIAIALKVF